MQAALEQVDDFENALGERIGAVGMRLGQAFDAGDSLVDARVVLHGAGAQRVHAQVDGVVPGGEPGEVADDFDLAQLRAAAAGVFAVRCAQAAPDRPRARPAEAACSALAGRGLLEDQSLVLRLVGADFAEGCTAIADRCHLSASYASTGAAPPALWPRRRSVRGSSFRSRTRAWRFPTPDTSGSARCRRRSFHPSAAGSTLPGLRSVWSTNSWKRGAPVKSSFAPGWPPSVLAA